MNPTLFKYPIGGIREGEEFEVEYNPDQQQQHRVIIVVLEVTIMEQLVEEDEEYHHNYEDDDREDLKNVPTRTISGDEEEDGDVEEGWKW